eukprot:scaffold23438_cov71-Cyclotella_meneghiniana.AAC.1
MAPSISCEPPRHRIGTSNSAVESFRQRSKCWWSYNSYSDAFTELTFRVSPITSKSQLEQSNGFRNIRVNASGRQIGQAIESVVIGSLQRSMIVLCV